MLLRPDDNDALLISFRPEGLHSGQSRSRAADNHHRAQGSALETNGEGRADLDGLEYIAPALRGRVFLQQDDDPVILALVEYLRRRQHALAGAAAFACSMITFISALPCDRETFHAVDEGRLLEFQALDRRRERDRRDALDQRTDDYV